MRSDSRRPAASGVPQPSPLDPAAPLDWPGEIVGGHPDRHVVRVQSGGRAAYLKRQHRVRRRDCLRNAWAGFGFVSNSIREAVTLDRLAGLGFPAPRLLSRGAAGGRAFVLLDAVPGVELRQWLATAPAAAARVVAERRRHVAGPAARGRHRPPRVHAEALTRRSPHARHHAAGLAADAVRPGGVEGRRVRALAALHAALADDLADVRLRLRVLRAYRRQDGCPPSEPRPNGSGPASSLPFGRGSDGGG